MSATDRHADLAPASFRLGAIARADLKWLTDNLPEILGRPVNQTDAVRLALAELRQRTEKKIQKTS